MSKIVIALLCIFFTSTLFLGCIDLPSFHIPDNNSADNQNGVDKTILIWGTPEGTSTNIQSIFQNNNIHTEYVSTTELLNLELTFGTYKVLLLYGCTGWGGDPRIPIDIQNKIKELVSTGEIGLIGFHDIIWSLGGSDDSQNTVLEEVFGGSVNSRFFDNTFHIVDSSHPLSQGVPTTFTIPMYEGIAGTWDQHAHIIATIQSNSAIVAHEYQKGRTVWFVNGHNGEGFDDKNIQQLMVNAYYWVQGTGIVPSKQGLKNYSKVPIGTAINYDYLTTSNTYKETLENNFNSVTPENEMKMFMLLPLSRYNYDWTKADYIVNYAESIGADIHGHTLVWWNGLPDWIYSFSGLKQDWKDLLNGYIHTVVGRYKVRIKSWDVVNEAVNKEGTGYNESIWYRNIGEEYIADAFLWAHEADPAAKLYYNDWGLESNPKKLQFTLDMITSLKKNGVPIDGIGFQMHISDDEPIESQIRNAINTVKNSGISISLRVSELDVSMNSSRKCFTFTDELKNKQSDRYEMVVRLFNQSNLLAGITVWGVSDANSWIRYYYHRRDWPLLFDVNYHVKPAFYGFLLGLKSS